VERHHVNAAGHANGTVHNVPDSLQVSNPT
jgi:hypothetical protein